MYKEHFGLTENAFELTADARFLYLSAAHARIRAYLQYALLKRDGIVVVTGDIGTGKSMLIADLASRLRKDFEVLVLHQTQLNELEILRSLQLKLGLQRPEEGKARTLESLRTALSNAYQRGKKMVLIVDEAHNLKAPVIEELRMLADDELNGERLLGLVLVGQKGLVKTLEKEDLAQVRQRVRLFYHLPPLSAEDIRGYINHRLQVAGCRHTDLFESVAASRVHYYTRGVPRLINILCDMALTSAAIDGRHVVTAQTVEKAAVELRLRKPPIAKLAANKASVCR